MKHMPWFRLYHEARNDRKLATFPDNEFRVWFNLLCFAAESSERGEVDASDMGLLALEVSGGDVDLLSRVVTRCHSLRMLCHADGVIRFSHWLERQYDKPSDRPDATRARQQRRRSKAHDDPPKKDVSRDVTPCHAGEERRGDKKRVEEDPPNPPEGEAPGGGVSVPAVVPSGRVSGRDSLYPADFQAFWNAYPRKEAVGAAFKAWKATAKVRPPLEVLIAAIDRQKRGDSWRREGGRYIRLPARWLSEQSWADVSMTPEIHTREEALQGFADKHPELAQALAGG